MHPEEAARVFFDTLPRATEVQSRQRTMWMWVAAGLAVAGILIFTVLAIIDRDLGGAVIVVFLLAWTLAMLSIGKLTRKLEAARRHFDALHGPMDDGAASVET